MSRVDLFCKSSFVSHLWSFFQIFFFFFFFLRTGQRVLCTNVDCSHSRGGGSSWKGGGQIVDRRWGQTPLAGVARVSALCLGKFCISELNSRDLCRLFATSWKSRDLFPIKVLLVVFCLFVFCFFFSIGLYEKWVIYPAHTLVPPRVPHIAHLGLLFLAVGLRFRKQTMQYTGAARGLYR